MNENDWEKSTIEKKIDIWYKRILKELMTINVVYEKLGEFMMN